MSTWLLSSAFLQSSPIPHPTPRRATTTRRQEGWIHIWDDKANVRVPPVPARCAPGAPSGVATRQPRLRRAARAAAHRQRGCGRAGAGGGRPPAVGGRLRVTGHASGAPAGSAGRLARVGKRGRGRRCVHRCRAHAAAGGPDAGAAAAGGVPAAGGGDAVHAAARVPARGERRGRHGAAARGVGGTRSGVGLRAERRAARRPEAPPPRGRGAALRGGGAAAAGGGAQPAPRGSGARRGAALPARAAARRLGEDGSDAGDAWRRDGGGRGAAAHRREAEGGRGVCGVAEERPRDGAGAWAGRGGRRRGSAGGAAAGVLPGVGGVAGGAAAAAEVLVPAEAAEGV
eukprot:Rhum_TRINITY_DN14717_c17_g1::Rhum_TRINITY_DN14717_c17_g1_i2::g.114053::m.114053